TTADVDRRIIVGVHIAERVGRRRVRLGLEAGILQTLLHRLHRGDLLLVVTRIRPADLEADLAGLFEQRLGLLRIGCLTVLALGILVLDPAGRTRRQDAGRRQTRHTGDVTAGLPVR